MFSLPIFIVPTEGRPEALATVMLPVSSMETFAEIVVEAVSKSVALVSAKEVAVVLVIAPLRVVSETPATIPPKLAVPKPVPEASIVRPMLSWYLATVEEPPLPLSEELAVAEAVIVYVLEEGTVWILNSVLRTAAVMFPPREAASVKDTKSPCIAPWLVSVTVIVVEPFVAENVAVPVVVLRTGVMSLNVAPSST